MPDPKKIDDHSPAKRLRRVALACFLLTFLFARNSLAFSWNWNQTEKNRPHSISAEEILSSPFAQFFKKHQYQKALEALGSLSQKYPGDPLILRYRALTLEKLGRTQEAIALYQKLRLKNPSDMPARIFLGRAYVRAGKRKAAAQEFHTVLRNGKREAYRGWAQAELTRLKVKARKAKTRRFYFVGKLGMAYDSNPLLVPNDSSLSAPGTQKRGADYLMDWTLGYTPLRRRGSRIDILYIGQETLHNPDASRVNFHSEGFALVAKKRRLFGHRAFLFGGRYDFRANFLRSQLFSVSNRFFLSADTSFLKKTRTHFYSRFNVLNFGPDGSNPSRTSRDGFRMGVGFTQYFYTSYLKRYFFVKEEFNLTEARGDNFDRRGVLSRVGIHTPADFLKKLDLDVSGGFDYGDYPEFSSLSSLDLEGRNDARWDLYSSLTYHWTPKLATRCFYRFIKSNNRNNFFDRDRHLAGGEVLFSI